AHDWERPPDVCAPTNTDRDPSGPLKPEDPNEKESMNNYTEYHDGFFDGLWIQDEGTLQVYLRTSGKKRNTVALTGVVMLKVTGFKAGNIIFEVLTRDHNEITLQDIAELYDLPAGHEPAKWE